MSQPKATRSIEVLFSLALFRLPTSQPYAWSAAVLVDELDAGGLERTADHVKRGTPRFVSVRFKLTDRDNANACFVCKKTLAPIKKRPSGPALL